MLIKFGVRGLDHLDPVMQRVLAAVPVAWEHEEPVVTSAREGTHMDGSLHYLGRALDFRLPTDNMELKVDKLKMLLGNNYDVVISRARNIPICIHVEFDPK